MNGNANMNMIREYLEFNEQKIIEGELTPGH